MRCYLRSVRSFEPFVSSFVRSPHFILLLTAFEGEIQNGLLNYARKPRIPWLLVIFLFYTYFFYFARTQQGLSRASCVLIFLRAGYDVGFPAEKVN